MNSAANIAQKHAPIELPHLALLFIVIVDTHQSEQSIKFHLHPNFALMPHFFRDLMALPRPISEWSNDQKSQTEREVVFLPWFPKDQRISPHHDRH
jgi:hypothetical protein